MFALDHWIQCLWSDRNRLADGSELSGLRGPKLGTGPRASAVEILERKLVQIFGCFLATDIVHTQQP